MSTQQESTDSAPSFSTVLALAVELARQAGAIILEGVDRTLDIQYKGASANDPVTDVDKRSEAAIAAGIRARFPHHRILSEEGTTGGDDPRWRWIVDPLDGTINYSHRLPFCCVSIGVEHDGQIVAGVVYNALGNELFAAERGKGATLNDAAIKPSGTIELRRALVSAAVGPWEAGGRRFERGRGLGAHVQAIRELGSAALELCYVASGRIDAMGGASLHAWDVAAGALILEEAGGQITDQHGDPFKVEGRHFVVSNGPLHGALMARLHDESTLLPPTPDAPAAAAPTAPAASGSPSTSSGSK